MEATTIYSNGYRGNGSQVSNFSHFQRLIGSIHTYGEVAGWGGKVRVGVGLGKKGGDIIFF